MSDQEKSPIITQIQKKSPKCHGKSSSMILNTIGVPAKSANFLGLSENEKRRIGTW